MTVLFFLSNQKRSRFFRMIATMPMMTTPEGPAGTTRTGQRQLAPLDIHTVETEEDIWDRQQNRDRREHLHDDVQIIGDDGAKASIMPEMMEE